MGDHHHPGVDAVVVNYRTPGDLGKFLESWQEHTPTVPWDLTIVNVEPTEEDSAVARWWADKLGEHAHVVEYAWNCGYAHAVNHVSLHGSRETFVAFNADVMLTADAVDRCHHALHSSPEWAVVGPRQINEDGRITHAGIFGTLEKRHHRAWQARDVGQFTDDDEHAISVSGSAYFVKRAVWEELRDCPRYRTLVPHTAGAFLPTLLFHEEEWCSVHAISHGYRIVFLGTVTIFHNWHQAVRAAGVEDWAARVLKESHRMYVDACASHGIPCD